MNSIQINKCTKEDSRLQGMGEFVPFCHTDQFLQRNKMNFDILTGVKRLFANSFHIQCKEAIERVGLQSGVWIELPDGNDLAGLIASLLQELTPGAFQGVLTILHDTTRQFPKHIANPMTILPDEDDIILFRQS